MLSDFCWLLTAFENVSDTVILNNHFYLSNTIIICTYPYKTFHRCLAALYYLNHLTLFHFFFFFFPCWLFVACWITLENFSKSSSSVSQEWDDFLVLAQQNISNTNPFAWFPYPILWRGTWNLVCGGLLIRKRSASCHSHENSPNSVNLLKYLEIVYICLYFSSTAKNAKTGPILFCVIQVAFHSHQMQAYTSIKTSWFCLFIRKCWRYLNIIKVHVLTNNLLKMELQFVFSSEHPKC